MDLALPHYGLLSFILHAFCEAFEPDSKNFQLEVAIDSAIKATKTTIDSFNVNDVAAAVEGMLKAQVCKGGGFLFLAGNGGSACDTFDIGSDVPVLFLAESGYVTCAANDFGYETIFSRAVESMEVGFDVFLGISTSGRSPNIVRALKVAKERGVEAIFLGGQKGGPATEVSDLNVLVGSEETNRIQEIHSMVLRGLGNWIRQC
jgi:D-sedoheptulose 7-phosphate isomerase